MSWSTIKKIEKIRDNSDVYEIRDKVNEIIELLNELFDKKQR